MSPDTLRTLRILAGLTQLGLAASLGVHRTTVARWETGKLPIPRWVELAMRFAGERGGDDAQQLGGGVGILDDLGPRVATAARVVQLLAHRAHVVDP